LSSTISTKIGQLTMLKHFAIGDNHLTGPLPIESLQKLTKMEIFMLSGNRVEGRIFDAAVVWSHLAFLGVDYLPLLQGSIPSTIGQLTRLVHFAVGGLEASLPTELGLLTALQVFTVSSARASIEQMDLVATLPSEIGLLTMLSDLAVNSDFQISGTIPTGTSSSCANLNMRSGPITNMPSILSIVCSLLQCLSTPELGRLTRLEYLNLGLNAFSGQLPSTMANLSDLKVLSLANCASLTGTVPQEFENLVENLCKYTENSAFWQHTLSNAYSSVLGKVQLHLSGTPLEGSLPQKFCNSSLLMVELYCRTLTCDCCERLKCIT
jgi:hypothetical protein